MGNTWMNYFMLFENNSMSDIIENNSAKIK
jgi:hypothetical protein